MAAKEPYDYLATATPDCGSTLTLDAVGDVRQIFYREQAKHQFDDAAIRVVTLSTALQMFFHIPYNGLSEADSGTLMELYCNTTAANGMANTFNFAFSDSHTYVCRFEDRAERLLKIDKYHQWPGIVLRVEGKITDA